jgi:hypothetical protein
MKRLSSASEQLALDACGDDVFPLISNDDSLAELVSAGAQNQPPMGAIES